MAQQSIEPAGSPGAIQTHPGARMSHPSRWNYFVVTIAGVCCLIVCLRGLGRTGWCEHGFGLWTRQPASPCTSQHLSDPYSLTHLEHGFIFYWLVHFSRRWTNPLQRYAAATALEIFWELLENSPWVIERYREQTAALGYLGDSILNSCGDLLSCCLGYAAAAWLPAKWTAVLAITIELVLLLFIRDNLTLNVLMLLVSVPAIERWQLGR